MTEASPKHTETANIPELYEWADSFEPNTFEDDTKERPSSHQRSALSDLEKAFLEDR